MHSVNQQLHRVPPALLVLLGGLAVVAYNSFLRPIYPSLFNLVLEAPIVKGRVSQMRTALRKKFEKAKEKATKQLQSFTRLPDSPIEADQLADLLRAHAQAGDSSWRQGQMSGCIYTVDPNLTQIRTQVLGGFEHSNPLHLSAFPGLLKMEAEIVHMVADMFNGDDRCVGSVTSGGTESLMLALKSYRDRFYKLHHGGQPTRCVVIAPVTIHPAIMKGCQYFGIEPVLVKVNPDTKKVNVDKFIREVADHRSSMCAIFLSAPNFPYGVMDPVDEICSKLHSVKGASTIPVHVDACLGSFVVPFLDNLRSFDFRVDAVTSISCDTHKYGLAPKGTSVLVYRDSVLFENQIFSYADWPGGLYASPNIAGSRSGYLIAACWATMLHIGRQGYSHRAKRLHDSACHLHEELISIGLKPLVNGPPEATVVAMTSNKCYVFLDELKRAGWDISALQDPPGFHIALTELHLEANRLDALVDACRLALEAVKLNDCQDSSDQAVLYGTSSMLPDRTLINDIAKDFVISFYTRTSTD